VDSNTYAISRTRSDTKYKYDNAIETVTIHRNLSNFLLNSEIDFALIMSSGRVFHSLTNLFANTLPLQSRWKPCFFSVNEWLVLLVLSDGKANIFRDIVDLPLKILDISMKS
jgi:hypothetical protein